MAQYFPNTTLIHGSINGGIGTQLSQNISWQLNANPWNTPGEICCSAVGGQILQADRTVVEDGNATSSTNGGSLWCALPEKGTYNTHYNTQPALVDSWAQCYNSSVASANNPGIYEKDTKPTSDVWQCELTGNFSGSNGFAYPSYASAPASGSGPQLGRFSLLAIAGVVSIASLAATSLAL